jgi:CheY-like chemotaxis protein
MQDVADINGHANVEPTITARGMQLVVEHCGYFGIRVERRVMSVVTKRILLVDDYPDALEIWGLYLRSMGYDVIEADNGLQAVAQAFAQTPDVIVLDLELPGITGFEAAIRLRAAAETRDIPLIAATGYSHVKQLEQARASGFDSIVVKPCEPAVLVAEIERVFAKRGSEAQPVYAPAVNRFTQNR